MQPLREFLTRLLAANDRGQQGSGPNPEALYGVFVPDTRVLSLAVDDDYQPMPTIHLTRRVKNPTRPARLIACACNRDCGMLDLAAPRMPLTAFLRLPTICCRNGTPPAVN